MKELEKKSCRSRTQKVKDEILTYANKDELANQVVTRTTADPEFRHFIVLTIRAITPDENCWRKRTMIKDSGDRTEFETGAKRDMHAGKGRMDLLPWYGIMEVSKHCEEGALKYGEHNVDKGIPLHSLLDSASRHLAKYMVGMDDEDHLRAACWNLLWALNQRVTHPELDDRFVPKMKSSNDEQFITVVCSSCGSHFEAPTEWWVRKRAQYTNIPDGVMTTCPHCGNVTIVREVKPDE